MAAKLTRLEGSATMTPAMDLFNNWIAWIDGLIAPLPVWLRLLVTLAVVLLAVLVLVPALWGLFRRLARRTSTQIDEILVASTMTPAKILIFTLAARVVLDSFDLPDEVVVWGGRAALVLGVLAFALFADRLVRGLLGNYVDTVDFLQSSAAIIKILARAVILLLGMLVILDSMGVSITPLLASLGVGSLAIALALQPSLAQFFAGLYLLMDQPIRVGDFIKMESGEEGTVEGIGWRSVRIRLLSNDLVIIPNDKMASATLLNYNLPANESGLYVDVGVAYESDLAHVEKVTLDVAQAVQKEMDACTDDWEPRFRYTGFNDSAIGITVILRLKEIGERYSVRSEFIKRLHARYRDEGITIPFPIRTLYVSDEDRKLLGRLPESRQVDSQERDGPAD